MASRINVKEHLDGHDLDLSMSSLTVVPIKELAALPKATHLDLSCNLLTSLPDQFCNLSHLIKLDLSKNQLTELPQQLGKLVNLQTLDLYENKIVHLPLSFCHLNRLKWLDLKGNPLHQALQKIIGDCLDERQCRSAATNIVKYMKEKQSAAEREKQKKLKFEREKAAEEAKREEEERLKKKIEKLQGKEKKRKEYEMKKSEEGKRKEMEVDKDKMEAIPNGKTDVSANNRTGYFSYCNSWWCVIFVLLTCTLIITSGLHVVCNETLMSNMKRDSKSSPPPSALSREFEERVCTYYNNRIRTRVQELLDASHRYYMELSDQAAPHLTSAGRYVIDGYQKFRLFGAESYLKIKPLAVESYENVSGFVVESFHTLNDYVIHAYENIQRWWFAKT